MARARARGRARGLGLVCCTGAPIKMCIAVFTSSSLGKKPLPVLHRDLDMAVHGREVWLVSTCHAHKRHLSLRGPAVGTGQGVLVHCAGGVEGRCCGHRSAR